MKKEVNPEIGDFTKKIFERMDLQKLGTYLLYGANAISNESRSKVDISTNNG